MGTVSYSMVNQLPILLENVHLQFRQNMFLHLQLDSYLTNFPINVRDHLDLIYLTRSGLDEEIYLLESADLISLNFYLLGTLKDIVYKIPPTTRDNMKL